MRPFFHTDSAFLTLTSVIPVFLSFLNLSIFFFWWCFFKKKSAVKNRHQWTPELQLGIQFRLAGPAVVEMEARGRGGEGQRGKWEEAGGRRRKRRCWGGVHGSLLVLDSPDGLDLGSLGMGAKLAVALVLSSATVALQDVLVATVTRVLVAHEAAQIYKSELKNCTHPGNKNHFVQWHITLEQTTGNCGDGLTLHSEYAWIQPPCSPSPWPAERGSRQTAQTDGPSCSPTRRWSCGTPCGSVRRRRRHKLKLSSVKEWATGLLCLCVWSLQHSRWAWRRSSSQCGRRCCHCRPRSGGSLPSPGQTAGRRSWSAHSPPSCQPEV